MNILHIGNTAGMGSIICHFRTKLTNHTSRVYDRSKFRNRLATGEQIFAKHDLDPHGIAKFYGDVSEDCWLPLFLVKAALKARRYDLVFVHDIPELVPFIHILNRRLKIILYYHGTRLRTHPIKFQKYEKHAHRIIVTTKDLLKWRPNAIYLPNLVDTDHFKPIAKTKKDLLISTQDMSLIPDDLKNCNFDYHHPTRESVPYADMPDFLNGYEMLCNPKLLNGVISDVHSGLELQALACGLTVIRNGKKYQGLPPERSPEHYIAQLEKITQ